MRNLHPTGTPGSVLSWAKKQQKPPKEVQGWFELRHQGMADATVISRWPASAARSKTWAEGVLTDADEDAATRGQLTEYQLVWMHDAQDVASRRLLRGANSSKGSMGNVSSPEDMVNASMKMVHDMHRMMLESNAALLAKQETLANQLFRRVTQLEAERRETNDLYIEALKMISAVEAAEAGDASEAMAGPNASVIQLAKLALMAVGSKDPEAAKKLEMGLKLVEGGQEGTK